MCGFLLCFLWKCGQLCVFYAGRRSAIIVWCIGMDKHWTESIFLHSVLRIHFCGLCLQFFFMSFLFCDFLLSYFRGYMLMLLFFCHIYFEYVAILRLRMYWICTFGGSRTFLFLGFCGEFSLLPVLWLEVTVISLDNSCCDFLRIFGHTLAMMDWIAWLTLLACFIHVLMFYLYIVVVCIWYDSPEYCSLLLQFAQCAGSSAQ